MAKLDFPKIIKTTTLTKLSHGEVKWIDTPTQIRASEFENIVPSKSHKRTLNLVSKNVDLENFAQQPKIVQKH